MDEHPKNFQKIEKLKHGLTFPCFSCTSTKKFCSIAEKETYKEYLFSDN